MSPNRIIAVLTPLVFAPLAGAIAAWVAENLPGVEVSASALEEIFIAGALIALAPAAQWLHGWQKHETREAEAALAAEQADAAAFAPFAEDELLAGAGIDEDELLADVDLDDEVEPELDLESSLDDEDLDLDELLADEEPARTGS